MDVGGRQHHQANDLAGHCNPQQCPPTIPQSYGERLQQKIQPYQTLPSNNNISSHRTCNASIKSLGNCSQHVSLNSSSIHPINIFRINKSSTTFNPSERITSHSKIEWVRGRGEQFPRLGEARRFGGGTSEVDKNGANVRGIITKDAKRFQIPVFTRREQFGSVFFSGQSPFFDHELKCLIATSRIGTFNDPIFVHMHLTAFVRSENASIIQAFRLE